MRVLVTGGAGFIGQNLTRRLVADGHEVTITAFGNEPEIPGVKEVWFTSLNGIHNSKYRYGNFDVVFIQHAINDTLCNDWDQLLAINVQEPLNILHQAYEGGTRKFVIASSTAIYGNSPAPYIEGVTEINPLNLYASSKHKIETLFQSFSDCNYYDTSVVALRYCNVYGPGEDQKGRRMSMIGQMIRKHLTKTPIELFEPGDQKRDWVYVSDVVEANLAAMNRTDKGFTACNVGSGTATSFNELIEMLHKWTAIKPYVTYKDCPFKDAYQTHTECDLSKTKRDLGWEPQVSVSEGVRRYCDELSCQPSRFDR